MEREWKKVERGGEGEKTRCNVEPVERKGYEKSGKGGTMTGMD